MMVRRLIRRFKIFCTILMAGSFGRSVGLGGGTFILGCLLGINVDCGSDRRIVGRILHGGLVVVGAKGLSEVSVGFTRYKQSR